MRFMRAYVLPRGRFGGGGGADVAEPAVPPLVFEDGFEQVAPAEIRPEHGRDDDLRVGDLPEEEIRHPHLAARPDEKVRIGHARGREVGGEGLFVEAGRR